MGATISILRRELGAYFNTPIGYVVTVAFLLITKPLFIMPLFMSGKADMRGFFGSLSFFMIFLVPAVSMRLWAEERKVGTMELLMTFPIKTWHAVIGKFIGGFIFILCWFVLTLDIPIFLFMKGNPDLGPILGGYLGAFVLAAIYLSIGCFASSLTSDQIIALVISIGINLTFWLMGYRPLLDWIKEFSPALSAGVERFGVDYHFESISRGVVDSRDIIYAVTLTSFFLMLNVFVVARRR